MRKPTAAGRSDARDAVLDEREAALVVREEALAVREDALARRMEDASAILREADLRDARADARDSGASTREQRVDRDEFMAPNRTDADQYGQHLPQRRAAALDREHAKGDRTASQDDRIALTADGKGPAGS